jgi:phosphatidylglycerol:prolipoprotein diacylglycerol transferase
MDPYLHIFNLNIRFYSIFVLLAVIAVAFFTEREAGRLGIKKDFVFNMLFWSFIFGILGARLYYVIFNFQEYIKDPIEIIKIWNGGLAIHGGLLAGVLTSYLYCKKYNVRPLRMCDLVCVPLLLGQAIGRWGNFFNQEAHGAATTVAKLKSLFIPQPIIDGMQIDGVYYFPTFFFESVICFVAFIILCIVRRGKYTKVGSMTASYLMIYGVLRFFIEIERTDGLMIAGFKMAQIVSVIMFIIGLVLMMYISRKPKFVDLYNDRTNVDEIRF